MEMFSAADEEKWSVIKRNIDQSDYYVVIVANRYGSTTETGISYTEKEFDYAVERKVPTIGLILNPSAPWPSNRADSFMAENRRKLQAFKGKIGKRLIKYWNNSGELAIAVLQSLTKLIQDRPRPGWIRGSEFPDPNVLEELSTLSKENAQLREELGSRSAEREVESKIDLLHRITFATVGSEESERRVDLFDLFTSTARQLARGDRTENDLKTTFMSWLKHSDPDLDKKVVKHDDLIDALTNLAFLQLVDSTLHPTFPYTFLWRLTHL